MDASYFPDGNLSSRVENGSESFGDNERIEKIAKGLVLKMGEYGLKFAKDVKGQSDLIKTIEEILKRSEKAVKVLSGIMRLGGTGLAIARALAFFLALYGSPLPGAKDLEKGLNSNISMQQRENDAKSKELLPKLKELRAEQMQLFLSKIAGCVSDLKREMKSAGFDPEKLANQSALRYAYGNTFTNLSTEILKNGYDTNPEFIPKLKVALGLKESDRIKPGAFISEEEESIFKAAGATYEDFKKTPHFQEYSIASLAILKLPAFKNLSAIVGDKGALHAIDILHNIDHLPAKAWGGMSPEEVKKHISEQKEQAKKVLQEQDVGSILAALDEEKFLMPKLEHNQGDRVTLEGNDPGFDELNRV
jgi:hypothetical protein